MTHVEYASDVGHLRHWTMEESPPPFPYNTKLHDILHLSPMKLMRPTSSNLHIWLEIICKTQ